MDGRAATRPRSRNGHRVVAGSWSCGRMLNQGEDAGCHEPRGAYRRAATGDLGDLHDAAPMSDLHPTTVAGRFDLICPGGAAGVDDNLGAITLHNAPSLKLMSQ